MLQVEHSAILLTFIKLPFVIKIFVLSIFGWPLKTCFTVNLMCLLVHNLKEILGLIFQKNQERYHKIRCLLLGAFMMLVGFVALRLKSTAMVIAGRSVHLTTLFPGQA